ncbi:hypothetical protein D3C83_127940 [compost metagenome]
MRTGEDRQADDLHVFLECGFRDVVGRAVEPRVDHLHARVTQSARDHLRAAVVPVEPGLRDQDADHPESSSTALDTTSRWISLVPS